MNKQESFLLLFGVINFIWIHSAMYSSDAIMDDIDWSSDLLVPKEIVQNSKIWRYLKHTTRWDSVFFIEISQNGYRYEKNHAFFPLFPIILNTATKFFQNLLQYSYIEVLLLTNLFIQFALQVMSIILMYRFSLLQLGGKSYALVSTILFIINPSAVHFNAIYTETIYTFALLLSCYSFSKQYILQKTFFSTLEFNGYGFSLSATLAAFLACLIRSNGTLLIIHIGYPLFQRFLIDIGRYINDDGGQKKIYLKNCIKEILWAIFIVFTVFLSQLILMKESVEIYCTEGNQVPWCKSLIPNVYPYIQVQHWNCGWLNGLHRVHYQLLIGIVPCIIVAIAIFYYFGNNFKYIITFGFNDKEDTKKGFLNKKLTPLILYTFIFWNIYFFYAAIDSSNRFFAHNPVYYWFIADIVCNQKRGYIQRLGCIIILVIYFIYYTIGIFLFPNFIVWT